MIIDTNTNTKSIDYKYLVATTLEIAYLAIHNPIIDQVIFFESSIDKKKSLRNNIKTMKMYRQVVVLQKCLRNNIMLRSYL